MLPKPWVLRNAVKPRGDEFICSVCLAARRAEPTGMIDAVVALGLAAEDVMGDEAEVRLGQPIVSRLLALSEGEAAELLDAVPPEVADGDVSGDACPVRGRCGFWNLAAAYVREAGG